MALTKAEQAELAQLESLGGGLTPEEQAELAQLHALAPNGDSLPPGLFAPEPTIVVPNQSLGYQAAATVAGLANTVGANKLAQAILPEHMEQKIVEQAQAAKENYPANFELGHNAGRAAPNLLPGGLAIQSALYGAGGAVDQIGDVTQDPSTALERGAKEGAKDALLMGALGYSLSKVGSGIKNAISGSAGARKAITASKNLASRGINKLADVLEVSGDEIAASKRLGGGFGTAQQLERASKLGLYDDLPTAASASGEGPTAALWNRAKDMVRSKSEEVIGTLRTITANSPEAARVELPLKKILTHAEDARRVNSFVDVSSKDFDSQFNSMIKANPQLAPFWNEAKQAFVMTAEEAHLVKQEMWQASKNLLENKLPKDKTVRVLEALSYGVGKEAQHAVEQVGGTAIKELNKDIGSAMLIEEKTGRLLGKASPSEVKNINPGRFEGAVQEFASGSGGAVKRGLKAGKQLLMNNQSLNSANQMIQQAPVVMGPNLSRNIDGVLSFMQQNRAVLPPATASLLDAFARMPRDQQEKMAPAAFTQLEETGAVTFDAPKSGYRSEVNGKLTDPVDIIAAGKQLWARSDIPLLERTKQWQDLNKNGIIPPALVVNAQGMVPAYQAMAPLPDENGLVPATIADPATLPPPGLSPKIDMILGRNKK